MMLQEAPSHDKRRDSKHRHGDSGTMGGDEDDGASRDGARSSKRERRRERRTSKRRSDTSAVSRVNGDDGAGQDGTIATNQPDGEERRRARAVRKLKEHYATLGLDENGDPLDNFSLLQYPVREYKFSLPGSQDPVAMNPVVTLLSVLCLLSFVIWASVDVEGVAAQLVLWRDDLTLYFTWLYQCVKVAMFVVIVFVTYRYGHVHLGRKKDKPEFSTPTYFCMTFAANVASSLLANCAADPLIFQTDHYYAKAGYRSQDELDMFSLNAVASNWGVGSWISITLVAICMAVSGFCLNLPFCFRSCYHPMLGAYTWGWMGDLLDTMAIVAGAACTCAILGTTAVQVTAGLHDLGYIDPQSTAEEQLSIKNVIIWVITLVSTISVLSGLRGGIQIMPVIAVFLGLMVTFLVLALDDTKFALNLTVQEAGYYLQNSMLQLNFWTDAFGQLRDGSGRAVDGKAAETWWTGAWPIAYQAWALCLSPVIGLFVAYISRGRKLWEVVMHSFFAPIGTLVVWSSIWAGASLRQTRQALELMGLGELYFNNSGHFLADGSEFCYDVPQEDVLVNEEVVFTNHLPGVTPVCSFDPDNPSMTTFHIFESFRSADSSMDNSSGRGLSITMSVVFLLGCAFFYVAHADALTFTIDMLASNGRKNYHWSRRMFWAGTIAALTTTLESVAVEMSTAISSFTLLCSFPMLVILCYLMQSVILLCQAADALLDTDDSTKYIFPNQPVFGMPVFGGVFNIMEYIMSLGSVNVSRIEAGMHLPTREQVDEFVIGLFLPFVSLSKVLSATYPACPKTNAATVLCYSLCYLSWVSLAMASLASYPGLMGVSATFWGLTGLILAVVRCSFRLRYNIRSNGMADWVCSTLMWPQVLAQMRLYQDESVTPTARSSKRARPQDESAELDKYDV